MVSNQQHSLNIVRALADHRFPSPIDRHRYHLCSASYNLLKECPDQSSDQDGLVYTHEPWCHVCCWPDKRFDYWMLIEYAALRPAAPSVPYYQEQSPILMSHVSGNLQHFYVAARLIRSFTNRGHHKQHSVETVSIRLEFIDPQGTY